MRRFGSAFLASVLLIGSAAAADMPVKMYTKAPPMAVTPPYNWTGFYIGGHIGGAWSDGKFSDPTGANFAPAGATIGANASSVLGGPQIGYNWQTGHWVLGIQGDWAWTDISTNVVDPFVATTNLSYKTDWIAMLTGRVGYAWDNRLFYVKGGAAWVRDKYVINGTNPFAALAINATGSETHAGWTVGTGFEYGFTRNWTGFIEYDYIGIGKHAITVVDSVAGVLPADFEQNINIVKAGINYRFNPF